MSIGKIIKALPTLLTAAAFICCILLSQKISDAVYEKLIFCGKVIIPQLFISMAVSSLVAEIRLPCFIKGRVRTFLMLLTCALCGFPCGAITAKRLYDKHLLDKKSAAKFCACSGSVSASFMIGYVGSLTGVANAVILLCAQIAILTVAYYANSFECPDMPFYFRPDPIKAIKSAGRNCMDVCAVITAFSLPATLLTEYIEMSKSAEVFVRGIFEFSSGVSYANGSITPTAIICGFGGICVAAQIKAITDGKISIMPFLAVRAISAAVLGTVSLFLT